jgi:hypothetical protein
VCCERKVLFEVGIPVKDFSLSEVRVLTYATLRSALSASRCLISGTCCSDLCRSLSESSNGSREAIAAEVVDGISQIKQVVSPDNEEEEWRPRDVVFLPENV